MADAAEVALWLLALAGLVGVVFYGFASYKIGEKFGKWGSPYFAVYAVLFLAALVPTPASEPVANPLALLMSLVSWLLYTHLVLRHRIVGALLPVRVAAILLGLLALVVFPLLPDMAAVFALLYRGGVLGGWLAGARAHRKARGEETAPAPEAAS